MPKLRPRTRPTIPGNLTETQRKAEFQKKRNEFLGKNSTNLLLYCFYFISSKNN
jgi:hypothetical protein